MSDIQDAALSMALLQFMRWGKKTVAVPTTVRTSLILAKTGEVRF
jgi:hypothetical protein